MSFLSYDMRQVYPPLTISAATIHVPTTITATWTPSVASLLGSRFHTCSLHFTAGRVRLPESKSAAVILLFEASREFPPTHSQLPNPCPSLQGHDPAPACFSILISYYSPTHSLCASPTVPWPHSHSPNTPSCSQLLILTHLLYTL